MPAVSRRRFIETSAGFLYSCLSLTPIDYLRIWNSLGKTIDQYGFATGSIPARRTPDSASPIVGFFQKNALLRYNLTDIADWVAIKNDTNIHLPDRVLAHGEIFVPQNQLRPVTPAELTPIKSTVAAQEKKIEISLTKPQRLKAFSGERIDLESPITAGLGNTTPYGEFRTIWSQMSRYMQGVDFDLPGVPWVMYFTNFGHALHGAYWRKRDDFGRPGSHGCINLPLPEADFLWRWADHKGTRILIND